MSFASGESGSTRAGEGPYTPTFKPSSISPSDDADALRSRARKVAGGRARAAVLGANDGLVSNLCLILGVAGASASQSSVRLAGFASLIAGAASMAVGEWISVRSNVELLSGVVGQLRTLIERNPRVVLESLVERLTLSGVAQDTAWKLVSEMPLRERQFFEFSSKTLFNLDPQDLGNPITAAVTSLVCFGGGALVPLIPWLFVGGTVAVLWSIALTAAASIAVGALIGRSSGTAVFRPAVRQLVVVVIAAATTFVIGRLFGTALN
jgi:vacuolar iron transporter family protein